MQMFSFLILIAPYLGHRIVLIYLKLPWLSSKVTDAQNLF